VRRTVKVSCSLSGTYAYTHASPDEFYACERLQFCAFFNPISFSTCRTQILLQRLKCIRNQKYLAIFRAFYFIEIERFLLFRKLTSAAVNIFYVQALAVDQIHIRWTWLVCDNEMRTMSASRTKRIASRTRVRHSPEHRFTI
jgi:hypothetical protein